MGEDHNDRIGVSEWLGLTRTPNFLASRKFGSVVMFLLSLLVIAVAIGAIATFVQFLIVVLSLDASHEAIRNIGLVLVAVVGAPFVVWRSMVAQKQANTAEQSHITDQINKAVEGLGAEKTVFRYVRQLTFLPGTTDAYQEAEWQDDPLGLDPDLDVAIGDWQAVNSAVPNLEVRIGAIYALERISQDSARDHMQIMEILCAYIRNNSPSNDLRSRGTEFNRPEPRDEIQIALDVLARRSPERVRLEHRNQMRLNLKGTQLAGANFGGGNFSGALLFDCDLEAANFDDCDLRGSRWNRSLINFATFWKSNLTGAMLDGVTLTAKGGWENSILGATDISGISLIKADISALDLLPQQAKGQSSIATKDTKLAYHLDKQRTENMELIQDFSDSQIALGPDIDEENMKELAKSGFLWWSPYESQDLAVGMLRQKLWDNLGLRGFPYN